MKKLLFLSLTFIGCFTGRAQSIDRSRLDSLFNALESNNLAIGSITITQDGKPVYRRTFGKGASPEATYRIGSITKVFTAVMIYELIDQKKLKLEDTLSEYFPQIPNAGQITIGEMLGHRSGIADFTAAATGFDSWKGKAHTHDQLVSFITLQASAFDPGAKADYNNSNFLLLGYVLESIYQKSYKDLVTEKIIHKLDLRNTYYGDHSGFQGKEAPSYKYFDNQWQEEKAVYLDNFGGAGGIISTPDDLCKFIRAIFEGKFISKASVAHMTHIEKDGYGWGMFSFGDSAHTGYGHGGKTEGFASSMQYYPTDHLAIGYCTNGESYPKDLILDAVINTCFHSAAPLPSFKIVGVGEEALQPLTGTYVGDNGLQAVVSVSGGGLVLETKGQKFVTDALSEREFHNVRFGFFFDFDKDGKQLVVHDAASTYWLHRQ